MFNRTRGVMLLAALFTAGCGESATDPEEEARSDLQSRRMTYCKDLARKSANYPASVDFVVFGWASGLTYLAPDGSTIRFAFSAKNAFGMERRYTIYCTFGENYAYDLKDVELTEVR